MLLGVLGSLLGLCGEILRELCDSLASVSGDQGHYAAHSGSEGEGYLEQVIEGDGG